MQANSSKGQTKREIYWADTEGDDDYDIGAGLKKKRKRKKKQYLGKFLGTFPSHTGVKCCGTGSKMQPSGHSLEILEQ